MAVTSTKRRIVIKVGSSSITGSSGRLDLERLEALSNEIADLFHHHDCEVVLVSSGAVAAGVEVLHWDRANITMPEKQAAAAVGQGLLINRYAELFAARQMQIGQVLLTRSDVDDAPRLRHICNTMETLLKHGVVPIVNENDTVAVDEMLRVGDNDTLSSLVARVVQADLLVLLTDVDGFYTADPRTNPAAERIGDIWDISESLERAAGSAGSVVGTGGMQTKVNAAKIATEAGIDVVVAASATPGVLVRIVRGESLGTRFHRVRHVAEGMGTS